MEKQLNTYVVTRIHCTPNKVVVMAENKEQAKKLCNKEFGFSETIVSIKTKKGIILYKTQ